LTTEERLSDILETLAYGLLWLDAFSVDLCSQIGSSAAALAQLASWLCYQSRSLKIKLDQGDSAPRWLVYNHPSGDPSPSRADIQMTQEIVAVAKPLGISVHDHIIIGKDGHASLRGLKLI
jgi:hypothetical protein